MSPGAYIRWAVLLAILLSLIILPFLAWEAAVSAEVLRFLNADHPSAWVAGVTAGVLALDVLLPVPSSVVNVGAGALLGFPLATAVCWAGMTIGWALGYWIGATGGATAVRALLGDDEAERAKRLSERIGVGGLLLARAVPVLAEASTIAAGTAGLPLRTFLIATALANLGIAGAYAFVGTYALAVNSFLLALAGAVVIPGIAYLAFRVASPSRPS